MMRPEVYGRQNSSVICSTGIEILKIVVRNFSSAVARYKKKKSPEMIENNPGNNTCSIVVSEVLLILHCFYTLSFLIFHPGIPVIFSPGQKANT